MHDEKRLWTVQLEQRPQGNILVPIDGAYMATDLETLRLAVLRYVSMAYVGPWKPRHFAIRARDEPPVLEGQIIHLEEPDDPEGWFWSWPRAGH